MNDFYITLLSDSSINLYPENSLSTFRNNLTRPIHLERDKWVVGLAELSYSQGFTSLDEEVFKEGGVLNKNIIITRAGKIVFNRKDFVSFADLYNTIKGQVKDRDLQELLLTELQGYLLVHKNEITNLERSNTEWHPSSPHEHTSNTNSVLITVLGSKKEVVFESKISFPTKVYYGVGELVDYIRNSLPNLNIYKLVNNFMLGVVGTDIKTILVRPIGRTNLQFEYDTEAVFVYCNIIQPQLVGDSYVRCLRVIQFPSVKSHHIFDTIYYVPVELNSFQTLAIEMTNKFGELARISNSIKPTTLILHFKKIL
jgi:hypothetical protein